MESRALRSQSRVVHVIYNLELFIVLRAPSLRPGVIRVICNHELFIESRALSSQLEVIYVIPELFKALSALST